MGVDENQDKLERQIATFYNELPWLQGVLPFESRGEESAEEWLKEIDKKICSRTGEQAVYIGFKGVTKVVEEIGVANGWKLKGYSSMMCSDPQVHELLHLIKVRNMGILADISPEATLIATCIMGAVSCNSMGGRPEVAPEKDSHQPVYDEWKWVICLVSLPLYFNLKSDTKQNHAIS